MKKVVPMKRLLTESRRPDMDKTAGETTVPLRVDPDNIRFESIRPGVLYVMTFSVRNNTLSAQRVRIQGPKSNFFALNYVPSGVVAPGLDVRAEIECQLPENSMLDTFVFQDTIVAQMGPYIVEIPLYASRPAAKIVYNNLANFGFIAEGVPSKCAVEFKNVGQIAGAVTFRQSSSESNLKISPKRIQLDPDEFATVELELECNVLGPWRELVSLEVNGSCTDSMILDVNAQVVNQKLVLLAANNAGVLDSVDFGDLFYGQAKTISALLVNTGPQQLSFSITFQDDEDRPSGGFGAGGGSLTTPQTDGDLGNEVTLEKMMTVLPLDGIVKPFSQVPVVISFKPLLPKPGRGFAKQFISETKEQRSVMRRVYVDSV